MPDETGTQTTHSDAPSVDDSLFGDTAGDPEAAVADEEDSNKETAQEAQGSDDAEDQPGPPEDLKVIVSVKGGRATIGVQRPSADPHIESFDDCHLSGLTHEVSAVVERGKAKWEDAPRYPAHVRPTSLARRQTHRGQAAAQAEATEGGAEQQRPETLRLF